MSLDSVEPPLTKPSGSASGPPLDDQHPARGIFCNRTLNFRALRAIGYDMDYTLVDYRAEAFERRVYDLAKEAFVAEGLAAGGAGFRSGHGGPRAGDRHGAGQPGEGQPLRLREAGHARHGGAGLRGPAGALRPRHRGPQRVALGVPEHALLAVRGLPVRAVGGLAGPGRPPRAFQLPGTLRKGPGQGGRPAPGRQAEGGDRAAPGGLCRRGFRGAPGAAGPEGGGQEAAADHQFRVGVHPPDDGLRLRSAPARGHEVAGPVRPGDRRRAQARLLHRAQPLL